MLVAAKEPKPNQIQIQDGADQFEIIEVVKENMDQLAVKKIELQAKRYATDKIIETMAVKSVDIKVVSQVIREIDDVKSCELLQMAK